METTLELLDHVEEELIARSFLYTDPIAYRDGVGAATTAVRAMLRKAGLAVNGPWRREGKAS